MATAEVIAENEVTRSTLAQIFKCAFFKTSLEDGDDFFIVYSNRVRVLVTWRAWGVRSCSGSLPMILIFRCPVAG